MKIETITNRLQKQGYRISHVVRSGRKSGYSVRRGLFWKIFDSPNQAAIYFGFR